MSQLRWGVHASSSNTTLTSLLQTYADTGMKCVQIFFGSPMSLSRTKLSEVEESQCAQIIENNNLSFNTHFPYAFNMCDPKLNMGPLQAEISRVSALGGRVVLHTGSCTSACCSNRDLPKATPAKKATWESDWRTGADILISHLRKIRFPDNVDYPLLLEPPAGEGKKLGWHIEQLKYIFDRVPKQVGFCLDTCHAFAAGLCRFQDAEQVSTLFDQLEYALGDMHRFRLIHLNDSKDQFGSMKDTHEVLKLGNIWSEADHEEGLIMVFVMANLHGIDIVSEVGTDVDIKVMKEVVQQLKDAEG